MAQGLGFAPPQAPALESCTLHMGQATPVCPLACMHMHMCGPHTVLAGAVGWSVGVGG